MRDLSYEQTRLYQEAFEYLDYPKVAGARFLNILRAFGENYLQRTLRWLDFFLDRRILIGPHYNALVQTLLSMMRHSEAIRRQDQEQFKASLYFLDQLLPEISQRVFDCDKSFKLLLSISLFYGRYPGLQVRGIRAMAERLPGILREKDLLDLLAHICSRYPDRVFIIRDFPALTYEDWPYVAHCCAGKNPRSYLGLPMSLSKREAQMLIKYPLYDELKFETEFVEGFGIYVDKPAYGKFNIPADESEDVLLRHCVLAKLIVLDKDANIDLLRSFINSNNLFQSAPDRFAADLDFWKAYYRIVLQAYNEFEGGFPFKDTYDFVYYKKYHEDATYSLKGRNMRSILAAMQRWHQMQHFINSEAQRKKTWRKTQEEPYRNMFDGGEFVVEELSTGEQLFEEGFKLKHCVFSYIENCEKGNTRIFSLSSRNHIQDRFAKRLTIEVRGNEVVQVAGKYNHRPEPIYRAMIRDWAKWEGLRFSEKSHFELP